MIDPYHVNQGDVIKNLKSKDWSDNLINKYLKYINSKSRVIKTGRTAFTDSGKSKTYKAEWKFQSKFKYDIVDFDNGKNRVFTILVVDKIVKYLLLTCVPLEVEPLVGLGVDTLIYAL